MVTSYSGRVCSNGAGGSSVAPIGAERIVPGLYRVLKGYVNAYLIEDGDGLVLVDCGLPKRAERMAASIRAIGRQPSEVRHIVITHHHLDHVGSLAVLARRTGATVYAHPIDAEIVRGDVPRPRANRAKLSGRLLGPLLARIERKRGEPAAVDRELGEEDTLELAGGIRVIHTPGHTMGQVSLLWPRHGGVLIAGDAAGARGNRTGPPIGAVFGMYTEDLEEAKRSFVKLSRLEFEVAVFGHGNPIRSRASEAFREGVRRLP
jgi:glyoxylase-like metal-dependent hydrolase (beta-lactamase superfamily II)